MKIIKDLEGRPVGPRLPMHILPLIYVGLGDRDQAMSWLTKPMRRASSLHSHAPRFDPSAPTPVSDSSVVSGALKTEEIGDGGLE